MSTDVITADPSWGAWSSGSLGRAADEATLIVNALIYAEVSIGFASIEALEEALLPDLYRREHLARDASGYRTYVPTLELIAPDA